MDLLSVSSCVRVRMLLKNLSVSWPTLYTGKATGLSRIKRWHRTWRRTSCELSFFLGSTWQQACHCMRNICDLAITRRFDRWRWSRGLRRRAAAQRRYFGRACPSRLSTSLSTPGCSCRNQRCKQRFHVFLPRCIVCNAVLANGNRKSVRIPPSICLSNPWIVTKRTKLPPKFLYHMNDRCI